MTSPLPAKAITTPIVAAELCTIMVATVPMTSAATMCEKGMKPFDAGAQSKERKTLTKVGEVRRGTSVWFIMSMPKKRRPKPMMTSPQYLPAAFLLVRRTMRPIKMQGRATSESPNAMI